MHSKCNLGSCLRSGNRRIRSACFIMIAISAIFIKCLRPQKRFILGLLNLLH